MSKYKIALFDVDGVLAIPPKLFSDVYCERFGIDPEKLQPFYSSKEFDDALLGKMDLKDAIKAHNDTWQWEGNIADLIQMWLEAENYPNADLLQVMSRVRENGLPVYLATQQEKYRAEYLQTKVFKDYIDGIFVSCAIGLNKHEVGFWEFVLAALQKTQPDIRPSEVVYFDDRQNIIDVAQKTGIDAHLYTNAQEVSDILCA